MDILFPLLPVAGSLTSPLPPVRIVGGRTMPLPPPRIETPLPT
jgi:hypothetical protein